jgi:uncharacterized protein (TIGR00251 family)
MAIRDHPDGARLNLVARPKSSRESIEMNAEGQVIIRINAPALKGQANARVIELLAQVAAMPKGEVVLVRGENARHKEVAFAALDRDELVRRLLAQQ